MTTKHKADFVTRNSVLKLLSDREVSRVSTAETMHHLSEGDEYVDLESPAEGVQKVDGVATPMDNVLPRKTVDAKTWSKILKHLQGPIVS